LYCYEQENIRRMLQGWLNRGVRRILVAVRSILVDTTLEELYEESGMGIRQAGRKIECEIIEEGKGRSI